MFPEVNKNNCFLIIPIVLLSLLKMYIINIDVVFDVHVGLFCPVQRVNVQAVDLICCIRIVSCGEHMDTSGTTSNFMKVATTQCPETCDLSLQHQIRCS